MDKLSPMPSWNLVRDEDNIAWLSFDKQDASVNTLSIDMLKELLVHLQTLETDPIPQSLVIRSSKKSGFIAGADIQEFRNSDSSEAALKLINKGQQILNRLANLPFPTLCVIDGFCLGGGLELALACRYRIAIIDPKTKLGLPEVKIGIHPGWGGTVRLPRLIGGLKAMDLILSGRSISAKDAFKMGVVDAAIPRRQTHNAIQYYLNKLPPPRKATWIENLSNVDYARQILGKYLRKQIKAKVNPNFYPAPFAALDLWIKEGVGSDTAFISEANSISQLVINDTARNLVRVFFLQDKLKSLGKELDYKPEHVHVIGAGVMGGDIAAWCVLKGMRVTLQDENVSAIAGALKRALILFKKQVKEPHLVRALMDRLLPDVQGTGIKNADLFIEAIVEKIDAKKELFNKLEAIAKPDAIFATNTSTIPLNEIAPSLTRQERLIGLHFFNPVAKMPLVEVISEEYTDPEIVKKGLAFVRSIDKIPVPVKSSPGFLVNRILMPYLLESVLLLESGVVSTAIDKAAVDFGMPMGPIELADKVGLDVCLYSVEKLSAYLGGTVPASLRQLVEQGNLGKKSGKGFYTYKNDRAIKPKLDEHYRMPDDVADRLTLRMLNEAVACLREQIVLDPDYIDAGMIFGTGFPPFRGGPLHYIHEQGASLLLQRMNLLAQRYGDRFLPDKGWELLA